jgi:hypothetical protein
MAAASLVRTSCGQLSVLDGSPFLVRSAGPDLAGWVGHLSCCYVEAPCEIRDARRVQVGISRCCRRTRALPRRRGAHPNREEAYMSALDGDDTIYDTMVEYFREEGWIFQPVEGQPALTMRVRGATGSWACLAHARNDTRRFCFFSICPVSVPAAQLAAVAELLTRANYGLIIGNFELNYDDGEVRFRTSIDVRGARLETVMVRSLVHLNLGMMDWFFPALMRVLYSGIPPAVALQQDAA